MKATSKLSIILVLLSFSTMAAYSQCDTYLQKANTLFAEKKYEDAKRQYSNYKECKPNAIGIDAKIAECDRLLSENPQKSTDSQTKENNREQNPVNEPDKRTKIAIGIGSFSGYKSDLAKTNTTSAFTRDGRFIVSEIQNSRYGSNQQTSADVDYIVSATSTQTQSARREWIPQSEFLGVKIEGHYKDIPEVVNVAFTVTNAKTGQIEVNQTYNFNNIYAFPSDIFPVKFSIKKVDGKKVEMVTIGGGTYSTDVVYNVYELYNDGGYQRKTKIGELKATGNEGAFIQCKIKDGAKEIAKKFDAGVNLLIQK
jgi:hypothetical protein